MPHRFSEVQLRGAEAKIFRMSATAGVSWPRGKPDERQLRGKECAVTNTGLFPNALTGLGPGRLQLVNVVHHRGQEIR